MGKYAYKISGYQKKIQLNPAKDNDTCKSYLGSLNSNKKGYDSDLFHNSKTAQHTIRLFEK